MSNRCFHRVLRFFCLVALTLALCFALAPLSHRPTFATQASNPTQQVQQGVEAYQAGRFLAAIAHWQDALEAYPADSDPDNRAIVLQNLARTYQQTGQFSAALAHWQQALTLYQTTNTPEPIAAVLTEQAQVYNALGQPREAIALLCGPVSTGPCRAGTALALAQITGDRRTQVAALGSLGEAHRALQDFDQALDYAENQGLAIAESLADLPLLALLHRSIGITYSQQARAGYLQANATAQRGAPRGAQRLYDVAWQQDQQAQHHLQQSLALFRQTNAVQGETKTLLALFDVLTRPGDTPTAREVVQQAVALWETLPNTQEKVSMALRLTKSPQPLVAEGGATGKPLAEVRSQSSRSLCQDIVIDDQSRRLLEQSIGLAQSLQNKRLEASALGELGHLYECLQDYTPALEYTQQARISANDSFSALDNLHLWQWQAGRIYKELGQLPEAIAAYEQATKTLESVRSKILATTKNLQFDFRDAVTPVYRELADLQLSGIPAAQPIDQATAANQAFSNALGNIDALQLAELQNYFGSDCLVPVASQRLDEGPNLATSEGSDEGANTPRSPLGDSTALINTAILPTKTAVVLTLPNGTRYLHWIPADEPTLRQAILDLLDDLKDWNELDFNHTRSQQMYDWLIRPFETVLEQALEIDTLVFVQDGLFRNLPMAALYSGSEYLVERYAIATAPFLSLSNLGPSDASNLKALFIGVTQQASVKGRPFPALDFVASEAEKVKTQLPNTTVLLDSDLDLTQLPLKEALTVALQSTPYSVLHIATHGKFEAEPENSFLILGEESTITIGELDTLIREISPNTKPLELIVLSACQTATGDDRAALGLAGVTIRAGASSALATLWSVSDATTATLVETFYQGLTQAALPKAKALQQAQKHIIEELGRSHSPGIWAPFIVIGNWQ